MQNLLDQLTEVVDQIQNDHCNHHCSKHDHTAVKTIVCKLNSLAKEHRRKLQSLPADPVFCKSFKDLIKHYQSILISTLDSLYVIRLSCKEKHSGDACLVNKTLNTLIELLCFLQKQFPKAFDDSLSMPLTACNMHREKIEQPVRMLRDMLYDKKVNKSLLSVVMHPFKDFMESNKENYSFCDMAFLNSWMALLSRICKKPQSKREFVKLLCILIIRHDLNSSECMDYFSELFSKLVNLQGSVFDQLLVLNIFLKEIEKVQVTNPVGYNPDSDSIRIFLIKWLNAEIGFIQNSCHINDNDPPPADNCETSVSKLKLITPVPVISLLIKGLIENNYLEASTQKEVFRFFSRHFSSKKMKTISEISLSTKYHYPSAGAIEEFRKTILALLKWIQMQEPKTF